MSKFRYKSAKTYDCLHEIKTMHSDKLVNILEQRSSGILLPVFSLPGIHGIGDLGPSSRTFIDFLKRGGQSCWQILPLGPASPVFGNSPYMSFSSFAGNPLFISPEYLVEDGLLLPAEIEGASFSEYSVAYDQVTAWKSTLLAKAWQRFKGGKDSARLEAFAGLHPWVRGHALFLALKERFANQPWYQWPEPLRLRHNMALMQAGREEAQRIAYYIFEQYLFFKQWQSLHDYARANGIGLIGDLPIYVALDSVDVWCHQHIFQLDPRSAQPTHVAGVPPDYFSRTGQRWGNPLYRWQAADPDVQRDLFNWWEQRFRINFHLTDTVRVDHFRGFESYWAVPAEEETAINGHWEPGPGRSFFKAMQSQLGPMSIIAEDLGIITPEVEALRNALGYPGMKILLFAFDGAVENAYLPYNCEKNSVVYTGTHDNDTAVGWYLSPEVDPAAKRKAKLFARRQDDDAGSFHQDLIHLALSSPSNLAIFPMQDVLGFGNDCRLNTPGTVINNWQWRCAGRFLNDETADWLSCLTSLFGRNPELFIQSQQISDEHPNL